MDEYCEKICTVLSDDQTLLKHAALAKDRIEEAKQTFRGSQVLAMRLRDFTKHLVPGIRDRPRGKVKYFNRERGFGFIATEEGDVFVHYTAIKATINRYLQIDQTVEFTPITTNKGIQAEDVTVI